MCWHQTKYSCYVKTVERYIFSNPMSVPQTLPAPYMYSLINSLNALLGSMDTLQATV